MLAELHHLLARVRGTAVPRHSWSIFHPAIRSTALHPVHRLAVTRSPHLNLVQTRLAEYWSSSHVHPSKLQQTVMRWGVALAVGSATYQFISNLHTVPITGRTQVVVVSSEEEIEMGTTAAEEELKGLSFITSGDRHRMCVDIVSRLVAVSEHLFPRQYEWKVWVVDSPTTINACCYPGGKILVYTGILEFIDVAVERGLVPNKHDALAVILAHEIGHALARHTAERMSYLPLIFLQMVLSYESPLLQYLFEFAMNLPFSRIQEREADHIGIMLMAQACYDPRVAPMLWHAMEKVFSSEDSEDFDFDFSSTHPSHRKRERKLKTLVAEALALQRSASWCFQVKERVQQLLAGAETEDPFLQRILRFRQQQESGRGGRRRNTIGTIHEMENEEILKGLRGEQSRPRTASDPTV